MSSRKSFKSVLRNAIVRFSVILITVFALVMYLMLNWIGASLIERQNERSNEELQINLQNELDAYAEFIDTFFVNPIAYMSLEVLSNENAVYELLYQFVNQQSLKSVFYIVSPEGQTLFTNALNESPYRSGDIFLSGIFRQLKRDPSTTIIGLNKVQFQNNYRTVYAMGRGIVQNKQVMAYLLFDFLESDFNALIQNTAVDVVVITDQYENTIVSTNNTLLDSLGKFKPTVTAQQKVLVRDVPHHIHAAELMEGQIKIYTLSSMGFLDAFFISSLGLLLLFVVMAALVIWFASRNYANQKTVALDTLLQAIEEVQRGDLSTRVDIQSGDEFEEVGVYFNRMLENLEDLIVQNNELMSRTNLSEIKQLQAQFNPHFLFNALESFKYLIRTDTSKAEIFILRMAQLLRYSVQTDKSFVMLKDDIAHIKTYFDVQALRYGTRLSYAISIDPKVEHQRLPKLILQPIVENSFQHGDTEGPLHIELRAKAKGQFCVIEIFNNGQGLSPRALRTLRTSLEKDDNNGEHLGLYNVHRRIQLEYGASYGLKISSSLNRGFKVVIELPLSEGEGHA